MSVEPCRRCLYHPRAPHPPVQKPTAWAIPYTHSDNLALPTLIPNRRGAIVERFPNADVVDRRSCGRIQPIRPICIIQGVFGRSAGKYNTLIVFSGRGLRRRLVRHKPLLVRNPMDRGKRIAARIRRCTTRFRGTNGYEGTRAERQSFGRAANRFNRHAGCGVGLSFLGKSWPRSYRRIRRSKSRSGRGPTVRRLRDGLGILRHAAIRCFGNFCFPSEVDDAMMTGVAKHDRILPCATGSLFALNLS